MRAPPPALVVVLALIALPAAAQQSGDLDVDITSSAAPRVGHTERPEPLHEGRRADVRLVVTGGLAGLRDGYRTFWSSSLFAGNTGLPLRVTDAQAEVVRTDEGIFFVGGPGRLPELLAAALPVPSEGRSLRRVFLGPGAIALPAGDEALSGAVGESLARALAAVERVVAVERRTVGGVTVVGVDPTPHDPLGWPRATDLLERVPAARARLTPNGHDVDVLIMARERGATARAFGIVDRLLEDDDVATAFVDVGGALTSARDTRPEVARAVRSLLDARHPAALGVGRAELAAWPSAPDVLTGSAHVLAVVEREGLPPPYREATVGQRRLLFVALGGLDDRGRALLPAGAQALDAEASVELAGRLASTLGPELVLGIAHSDEGEGRALASSSFDAVLHLVSSRTAALPGTDDIDLGANHRVGIHAGPGLIRVSAADVTEVRFWLDAGGRVERLRIDRHAIVDGGAEAADALAAQLRLPARPALESGLPAARDVDASQPTWSRGHLSELRAEIVRRRADVEVSILRAVETPAPVEGPIPADLARAWLDDPSRVSVSWVRGTDLLKAFGALKKRGSEVAVAGGSVDAGTVARRGIAPLEYYRVATTPWVRALLAEEGVTIEEDDGRGAEVTVTALVDDALAAGLPVGRCRKLLAETHGRSVHAVFLEVKDLALSGAIHFIDGNEAFGEVRDARARTPNNFSLGLNGQVGALYDGPWTELAVTGLSQFNHVSKFAPDGTRTVTETRDLVLLSADARLKLVPLLWFWDEAATFLPRPSLTVAYQTEWTPNVTVVDGVEVTSPRRSELRGILGLGVSPRPWLRDLRLGLLVENDFATPTAGALEFGGEAALSGQWAYEIFRFSLDGYVRGYLPDPGHDTVDDLGLVAQAIARVEVPLLFDFSVSAFVDGYAARGKIFETRGPLGSVIVGAALSYGQRLKWVPFGR